MVKTLRNLEMMRITNAYVLYFNQNPRHPKVMLKLQLLDVYGPQPLSKFQCVEALASRTLEFHNVLEELVDLHML